MLNYIANQSIKRDIISTPNSSNLVSINATNLMVSSNNSIESDQEAFFKIKRIAEIKRK
jgi:hypothetical protein